MTDELAFERKDIAYEREYRDEWEDFDCINGLLDSQNKLCIASEDLETRSERNRSLQLRSEVQLLSEERQLLSEEMKRLKQGPD